MEIIIDNYLWFAVTGVILLMAFIGFIAEKTDFGRKEFEKKVRPVKEPKIKEPKVKKQKEEVQEIVEVIEETPVEEISPAVEEITEIPVETISTDEDLTVPLSDDSWGETIETPLESIITEELPVETMVEEISTEMPVEELPVEMPIEENIVEEIVNEEQPEEIKTVDEEPMNKFEEPKIELENLELPSIDSLKEEESEDDVWKF